MGNVFIKVDPKTRMPSREGRYITNLGEQTLFTTPQEAKKWVSGVVIEPSFVKVTGLGGLKLLKVEWWMQEVQLPSSEVINNTAVHNAVELDDVKMFVKGANFIMDKLK